MNLNRRISILQTSNVSDGQGGFTPPEYTEYWQTSAELLPLTGSMKLEDNQDVMNQVYVFRMRFRRDKEVLKNMQVIDLHSNLTYEIIAVTELQDKRGWLEIRAINKQ